jgi:hypothetical protein
MLHEVLRRYLLTPEGLKQAAGWVSLLETLRSPTDSVIFRLRVVPVTVIRRPGDVTETGLADPQGHAGGIVRHPVSGRTAATYSAEGTRSGGVRVTTYGGITTGTNHFHNALRAFFTQNASALTPSQWVDALLSYLPDILYTGDVTGLPSDVLAEPIGVFVTLPSGVVTGDMTVAEFAEFAAARWREIQFDFQAAKTGLPQ